MKKIRVRLSALLIIGLFWSCGKGNITFEDKSQPFELRNVSILNFSNGYNKAYTNPELSETVYKQFSIKETDSLFHADGSFDKMQIDTIYYEGKIAKLYTTDLVLLSRYKNHLFIPTVSFPAWNVPSTNFTSPLTIWVNCEDETAEDGAATDYDIQLHSANFDSFESTRRKLITQLYHISK